MFKYFFLIYFLGGYLVFILRIFYDVKFIIFLGILFFFWISLLVWICKVLLYVELNCVILLVN